LPKRKEKILLCNILWCHIIQISFNFLGSFTDVYVNWPTSTFIYGHLTSYFCFSSWFLVKEASKVVDVQDIKHILEDKKLIGDEMEKIVDDWNVQRDIFNQQRGFSQQPPEEQQQLLLLQQEEQQQHQDDEDFDQEDEDFDQLERLLSKA
jgi:hypothetical protein